MSDQMSLWDGGRDTLAEARLALQENLKEGTFCPCCDRYAKMYRRPLASTPVRALIALYRWAGFEWAHMPSIAQNSLPQRAHQGGYITLSGYWGLMIEEVAEREDGGRSGVWRISRLGYDFIHDEAEVPRFAETYGGEVLRLSGEPVGVREALGRKFDLRELMGWPMNEYVA